MPTGLRRAKRKNLQHDSTFVKLRTKIGVMEPDDLVAALSKRAERYVEGLCTKVVEVAKKSMKGGAMGKRRSSPGEPPYLQTRNLSANIDWMRKEGTNTWVVGLTSAGWYGTLLELGYPTGNAGKAKGTRRAHTRTNKKTGKVYEVSAHPFGIAKRPFLRPALMAVAGGRA